MRIFLTGASGLVGAAFARAATRRGHTVTGIVGGFSAELPGLAARRSLDLADESAVTAALLEVFPDAIVNCAAISVPEMCEADPARAQTLNVALPTVLARLAHHLSARLVHISSEQVFDGSRTSAYAIGDATSPINLYGRQKIASERAIQNHAAEFAVSLRAPLLMGNSPGGKRSTHERLFADWAAGRAVKLYADEFRQTCTAENLAEVMLELCERRNLRGVFHWAGAELLSRYELGRRIRAHFKLSETDAPITAITRSATPEAARKRQACLALDLAPLRGLLKTQPQPIETQLAELHVPTTSRAWYFSRQ
jgi:dTDP-4-dehydrorhamnose reductase